MARLLLTVSLLVAGLGALSLAGAPGPCVAGTGSRVATSGDRWIWPGPPNADRSMPAFYDQRRGWRSFVERRDGNVVWVVSADSPRVWTPLPIQGGSPVYAGDDPLAYDPAGDRLLFAHDNVTVGDTCCSYIEHTELWQVSLGPVPFWSQLTPPGAPPTFHSECMMVYDSRRNRALVFGGREASPPDSVPPPIRFSPRVDVLDLSGSGAPWTWFDVTGPALPVDHGIAFYDSLTDRVLVFGGRDTNGNLRKSIYALDLAAPTGWVAWSPADSLAFLGDPYFPSRLCLDPQRRRVVCVTAPAFVLIDAAHRAPASVTGSEDSTLIQVLDLDTHSAWVTVPYAGPSAHLGDSQLLYDPPSARLTAFGADSRNDVAELVVDGSSAWTTTHFSATVPFVRSLHAFMDDARHRVIALETEGMRLWSIDRGPVDSWRDLGFSSSFAPRRSGPSVAYDPVAKRGLMFGGQIDGVEVGDLWQFTLDDTDAVHWERVFPDGDAPAARWGAITVFDPVRRRMIVSGGFAGRFLSDTWALPIDPPFRWTRLPDRGLPPPPRLGASAVYDSRRDAMIVFGGNLTTSNYGAQLLNDTWAFSFADGGVWVPVTALGQPPAPRANHGAIYDPRRDRMLVLWGDSYGAGRRDAFELDLADGPTWRPYTPAGPAPSSRDNFGAVYDSLEDEALFLGGQDPNYMDTYFPAAFYADFSANPVRTPPPLSGPPLAVLGLAPNPTRDVENVAFDLPRDAEVHARIYDASGRLVRDLGPRQYVAGRHLLVWDGKNAAGASPASGVYFARLTMLGRTFAGKFVLLH